jgi:hypothetical protein
MIQKYFGLQKQAAGGSFLLDTYPAAFAVSLRQLKTGVTNVARFRRISDDAESDFTATEMTDGTFSTWVGASTAYLRTWYDQSGNGNDLTQTNSSLQAAWTSGGIEFSSDYYTVWSNTVAPTVFQDISDTISCFYVFTQNTAPSGTGTVWYLANTIAEIRQNLGSGTHAPLVVGNDSAKINYNITDDHSSGSDRNVGTTTITTNTDRHLVSNFVLANDDIDCYLDGVFEIDNNAGSGTGDRSVGGVENSTFVIGARSKNTGTIDSDFMKGKLDEFILMKTDELSNRTTIESDINTYYSIY